MARTYLTQLFNREAQTSDTSTWREDLIGDVGISALDLGFRITNGSTSAVNLDILDVIKKIVVQFNGAEDRFKLTGQELYRHNWIKNGAPLPNTFDQSGSAVQEVWFRIMFGRFLGDPLFGLDLRRFNNVQIQADYDATVWGAAAATTFTTATCTFSLIAHQFKSNQIPAFRGMIGTREFWNGTSAASGDELQLLPTLRPIAGIGILAIEDNIAEATDITDVVIGRDNLSERWVDAKWYNLQQYVNQAIHEPMESYKLYVSQGSTLDCHLANIKHVESYGVPTGLVEDSTSGVVNQVEASGWTGNRVTFAGSTNTLDNATHTTQTTSNLSAKAAWAQITGDIHGYLYFPFAQFGTMEDLLTPMDLKGAQVKLTQGGAGATLGLIAEEIYT